MFSALYHLPLEGSTQIIAIFCIVSQIRVEGRTLTVAIQWCIQALKQCPTVASQDVLVALAGLIRGNGSKVQEVGS